MQQPQAIDAALAELYPEARCELDFGTPLQLLVATVLSAQSTDARVNLTTPELFNTYPDARALAAADLTAGAEVLSRIRATVSTIATSPSIPVLIASAPMSSSTARAWASTTSSGIG